MAMMMVMTTMMMMMTTMRRGCERWECDADRRGRMRVGGGAARHGRFYGINVCLI